MRYTIFAVILFLALTVARVGWPTDPDQIGEQIQQKKIMLGQSPKDLRAAIGEPTKVTKVRTYWQSTEDWVYGEGKDAFSFTFQEGRLTRIARGERPPVD